MPIKVSIFAGDWLVAGMPIGFYHFGLKPLNVNPSAASLFAPFCSRNVKQGRKEVTLWSDFSVISVKGKVRPLHLRETMRQTMRWSNLERMNNWEGCFSKISRETSYLGSTKAIRLDFQVFCPPCLTELVFLTGFSFFNQVIWMVMWKN